MASGGMDETVRVWDVQKGERVASRARLLLDSVFFLLTMWTTCQANV